MVQWAKNWVGYLFFILFAFICSIAGIYLLSRFNESSSLVVKYQKDQSKWSNLEFDCPSWINKENFIDEVRYLSGLGEFIDNHEPGITERISVALKKHPWVHSVKDIQRTKTKSFAAKINFKRPLALVSVVDPSNQSKTIRAIDNHVTLLPKDSPISNLVLIVPEITFDIFSQTQSPRKKDLQEIAKLMDYLDSDGNSFANMLVEKTNNGIEFRSVSGHIICKWGQPAQTEYLGNQIMKSKSTKLKEILEKANQPGYRVKTDLSIQDPR